MFDYSLRIARTAAGLAGVLVSPRSGEYKFKSVAWKDDVLKMAIVRSIRAVSHSLLHDLARVLVLYGSFTDDARPCGCGLMCREVIIGL